MSYTVRLSETAKRDFLGLPRPLQAHVAERLQDLAGDPRPPGVVPVKGLPRGNYRVRIGDYRVGYYADDATKMVDVWSIAPRDSFYAVAERRR